MQHIGNGLIDSNKVIFDINNIVFQIIHGLKSYRREKMTFFKWNDSNSVGIKEMDK
jgi:hypothetical protein